MNTSLAKQRIEKLKQEINHHRYLYHVLDCEEISDAALDSLKNELQVLESQYPEFLTLDSPTQRVGGKPLSKFQKIAHRHPILSLRDVFSGEEFSAWEERNHKIVSEKMDYYAELKFDGLTVVLTYHNGMFETGATRGDGKIGEDVTQNLRTIESIPLRLETNELRRSIPERLEIRGEVVMSKKAFERANAEQKKQNKPLYANPRNIAAGSIRQLDPRIAKQRDLDFYAFELLTDIGQKTHKEVHDILKSFGFKTSPHNKYCEDGNAVQKFIDHWIRKRNSLPFQVDGSVVVVNSIGLERTLGSVGKSERWMVAYKFPAEQATTILENIEIQIGRTGALTPVAHLKPVLVAGSTVSRATLHNEDEMQRLGIKIGDTVIIQKAGDVIPDIVMALPGLRTGREKIFHFPKKCPMCGSRVIRNQGEAAHYCTNRMCFAQVREHFYHFVSRNALNIEGLGPKIIDALIDAKLITDVADIFTLQYEDIIALPRFADKSAHKLIISIQKSRSLSLPKFLFALGIRHIGVETAELVSQYVSPRLQKHRQKAIDPMVVFDSLTAVSREDFDSIEGFGPRVSESVYEYFQSSRSRALFHKFSEAHVIIAVPEKRKSNFPLQGKSFVLTGTLSSMSRSDAREKIMQFGGKVSGSVSASTSYVVVGENPGSKYANAQKLGIPVLSENEFKNLLR